MKVATNNVRQLLTYKKVQWKVGDYLTFERLEQVNSQSIFPKTNQNFYATYMKRVIDFCFALLALIITLPINLIIAIVTFFEVGRPIFFVQERTGRDGKSFKIVKFRNMRNAFNEYGEPLPAKDRVTKWGKFFRETSLDELLNFWTILKGDMSLIGPRPLPPQYINRYSERHKCRLNLRPGLECPPKDKSSNIRTWQDQFENDVWYVENVSFFVDCKMMLNLIFFALDRKNSKVRGGAQRGSFIGYSENGEAISVNELSDAYAEQVISQLDLKDYASI
ncbi:sugar transferase [Desulfosporosinus nitroreducens]|uniref:Sugar transferase n=1 Tax=Desulfosporosinus nitroreducens TaxID=2018668 RepID=A0ABT8QSF4_9FIRM|nr:sugar transferase [Desulfosporosinus nitroreducens]MDO0824288.1 sugar transferase [Desulfosporosinus nitroreducens]